MRVIVRKERPHPGAQLRITDVDGHAGHRLRHQHHPAGNCADLELRHRRRARAEDRIRGAKDTGLTNLPLHDFAQNQIWCAIVALAVRADRLDADCSPSPGTRPAGGNPNGSGSGCSPSRPRSPAPAAAGCCTWPTTIPGPPSSSTPSTGSATSSRHQHAAPG